MFSSIVEKCMLWVWLVPLVLTLRSVYLQDLPSGKDEDHAARTCGVAQWWHDLHQAGRHAFMRRVCVDGEFLSRSNVTAFQSYSLGVLVCLNVMYFMTVGFRRSKKSFCRFFFFDTQFYKAGQKAHNNIWLNKKYSETLIWSGENNFSVQQNAFAIVEGISTTSMKQHMAGDFRQLVMCKLVQAAGPNQLRCEMPGCQLTPKPRAQCCVCGRWSHLTHSTDIVKDVNVRNFVCIVCNAQYGTHTRV